MWLELGFRGRKKSVSLDEKDLTKRDSRFCYPIRIPVTQDCNVFHDHMVAKEPIVYYDNITQQITIEVSDANFLTFSSRSKA